MAIEPIAQYEDGAGVWRVTKEGATLAIHTPNGETLYYRLARAPEYDAELLHEFIITDRYASCDDWENDGVVWVDGMAYMLEGGGTLNWGDRVPGDTPTTASALKVGDVLRAYSGIQDVITVTSVEREAGQGARYAYTIVFSDTTVSRYVEPERRYDLATAGPRKVAA